MSTDDCIIFCKATKEAAKKIKYMLDHYCKVSIQFVNYQKSKIKYFKSINNAPNILQITSTNAFDSNLDVQKL